VNKENKKQKIYEKKWFAIGLIVLVTFLVYSNTFKNEFVYEDHSQIVNNNFIKDWKYIPTIFKLDVRSATAYPFKGSYYRPLFLLSFIFDYSLWHLNPVGYHLTNLLIYIVTSVLIYILINYISKSGITALLTTLFFVVHPVHTEVVTYISGRDYLLSFLFYLLAFLLYIIHIKPAKPKRFFCLFFSLFFFFLALLSKEMAITLPFILLLYDFHFIDKKYPEKFISRVKKNYLLYFIVIGLYLILRVSVLGKVTFQSSLPYPGGTFYTAFLTMSRVFFHYIKLLIFPLHLSIEYVFPLSKSFFSKPSPIFSVFILFACVLTAFKVRKFSNVISFSIFYFFIVLLPVSQIIPTPIFIADRYLYFPSLGFCFLISTGIVRVYNLSEINFIKKAIILFFCCFFVFYSIVTINRNADWKDDITLWLKTVRVAPKSFRAHYNFGNVYSRKGLYNQAVDEYKKALQIRPNSSKAYNNLGFVYSKMGFLEKAIDEYQKAVHIQSDNARFHANLGIVFRKKNLLEKAIIHHEKAIKIDPHLYDSYDDLGMIYRRKYQYDKAIFIYKQAIQMDPDNEKTHFWLGFAYKKKGFYEQAIEEYRKAIYLKADYSKAHLNMGNIFLEINQIKNATEKYRIVVKLESNNFDVATAHNNLGIIYAKQKDYEKAFEEYNKAIEVRPNWFVPHDNLTLLYRKLDK